MWAAMSSATEDICRVLLGLPNPAGSFGTGVTPGFLGLAIIFVSVELSVEQP